MNAAVIIPAYDPEEDLIGIVDRVRCFGNRVIVVDDGSAPKKKRIFRKLRTKAIVICHESNRGKGAAIKTALRYIKRKTWDYEVIGVMDADGQHLPEDMETLLDRAKQRPDAMILGVRKVGAGMPLKSRIGNRITRFVFHLLSGAAVSDTQTGLRAFSKRMLDRLLAVEGSRYEYETNVLFSCARERIPIVEVPIETIYHDAKNSCSHFHPIRDSFRIYKDMIKFSLASLSSFLLDYLLFCLLVFLFPPGMRYVLAANVAARIISGICNYCLNCRFVFHSGAKARTAAQYLLLAVGILIMNNIILQFFSGICKIPVYAAKILTETVLFIISYTVQRMCIFREYSKA